MQKSQCKLVKIYKRGNSTTLAATNKMLLFNLPSINLIRNDRCLVDDDVHEPEDVGTGLEVEEDGSVTVYDGALGQDGDGEGVGRGHDLCRQLDGDVDDALLDLRCDRKVDFDFILSSYVKLKGGIEIYNLFIFIFQHIDHVTYE